MSFFGGLHVAAAVLALAVAAIVLVGAGLAQGATAALPQASLWPTVATTASVCLLAALATRAVASPKPAV